MPNLSNANQQILKASIKIKHIIKLNTNKQEETIFIFVNSCVLVNALNHFVVWHCYYQSIILQIVVISRMIIIPKAIIVPSMSQKINDANLVIAHYF